MKNVQTSIAAALLCPEAQSMRAFTEMNSGETKEVTGELRKARRFEDLDGG